MAEPKVLPLELTAPAIQRLVRKGLKEQLTESDCAALCACVQFHVDTILEHRRIPRVGMAPRQGASP